MYKCFALLSLLLTLQQGNAQKIQGKLKFDQGENYLITVELKNTIAQQAMGNAIDFTLSGSADHTYKVTNSTDDNTTLHHTMDRLSFEFDGMGQKRSFDSNKPKDIDGQMGKPVKELMTKTYDMLVDGIGKTLMCVPEKVELNKQDERLAIITNMLKDLTSIVYPPKKGNPSFFQVLPATEVGIGDKWQQTFSSEEEKSLTEYTLSAINDSLITVDFKTTGATMIKSEMMGMETVTNIKSLSTGQIFLDKNTHVIREKNMTVESNGATEAMGSSMPLSSKMVITIKVKK